MNLETGILPLVPDGLRWASGWCFPCGVTRDVVPIPAIGLRTVMTVCRWHHGQYSARFVRTVQLRPWYGLLSRPRVRPEPSKSPGVIPPLSGSPVGPTRRQGACGGARRWSWFSPGADQDHP